MKASAAVLCLIASVVQATAAPNTSSETLEQVNAVAETEMKEQQIPGLALVVMEGDEVVLARGFGREHIGRDDPVTADTVFALGSIAKQLLAALVLQLSQEGKLSVDDAVAQHLPDFTALPRELKIHHLLSHTSGMREEFAQADLRELFGKPGTTFREYVEAARDTPSDWLPGSRWSYGNVNYMMLTVIAERLTGEPLEQALAQRFFEPLGLRSMQLCASQPQETAGHARGYVRREGELVPHPPENVMLFRGSGGFCGSALDLARWTRALATGRVISPASYRQMTTRASLSDGRKTEYGFGIDLGSHDGVQRNGHGGYGGGFSAQAAYYPDAQLTVVVLTNRDFASPEQIERKISRRLLGRPEPKQREVALSAEELQRYTGSYDLGISGWYAQTVVRDGRLWFELPAPKITMPLVYTGNHVFTAAEDVDGYRLTFSKKGPADELTLVGMGMMTWYGVRRP